MLDPEQKCDGIYEEIDGHCPFNLARDAGIALDYYDFGEGFCGMYTENDGFFHIILNSAIDTEAQELTCYLLIKQHQLHRGSTLAMNTEDLNKYTRVERKTRNFLQVVTNVFLGMNQVAERKV